MNVVVTGAHGFIGQNLMVHLAEGGKEAIAIGSGTTEAELLAALGKADLVFHLAGVNRPIRESEFMSGNAEFTRALCERLASSGRAVPVVYASSVQAEQDNPYGRSKLAAEEALRQYSDATGAAISIFRLPNVFGKWARPNYNSAVATFCHNIARGLDIKVHDPSSPLKLAYIDDVCRAMLSVSPAPAHRGGVNFAEVAPVYSSTVGQVADAIRGFADARRSLMTDRVGSGLTRALYATYLSYLPPDEFAYEVPRHADPRGVFVEMLKTPDCGQFSYFTAGPGVTRGQHYHHTKNEKFLVLAGEARFGFRHILTNARHEIITRGGEARIVETVPGWTHVITNIGSGELVVMLWANEVFDPTSPDTVSQQV